MPLSPIKPRRRKLEPIGSAASHFSRPLRERVRVRGRQPAASVGVGMQPEAVLGPFRAIALEVRGVGIRQNTTCCSRCEPFRWERKAWQSGWRWSRPRFFRAILRLRTLVCDEDRSSTCLCEGSLSLRRAPWSARPHTVPYPRDTRSNESASSLVISVVI